MIKFSEGKRVVVKVGTSSLTFSNGKLNFRSIEKLAKAISHLENSGKEVVLVSSGAIGVGVGKLGLKEKPTETREKQAVAAVGQCELMNIYEKFFGEFGQNVAQILITKEDFDDEIRLTNATNTFDTLLHWGVIPIVNENDTIAVDEIVFGDNDSLSAVIASIIHADVLVVLTDIDGLYDQNPNNEGAKRLPVVHKITDELMSVAGGSGSNRGTGGMVTKLHAAEIAMKASIPVIIASGAEPDQTLYQIFDDQPVGTLFVNEEAL